MKRRAASGRKAAARGGRKPASRRQAAVRPPRPLRRTVRRRPLAGKAPVRKRAAGAAAVRRRGVSPSRLRRNRRGAVNPRAVSARRPALRAPSAPQPPLPAYMAGHYELFHRFQIISREQWRAAAARTARRRDGVRKTAASWNTDVLMVFTETPSYGAYRKDYRQFFYPVANRLMDRGRKVAILAHTAEAQELRLHCPRARIIYIEQLFTAHRIPAQAAQLFNARYRGAAQRLSRLWRLGPAQAAWIAQFYQRYAADQLLASAVLRQIRPRCVYGIHYIWNPGFLETMQAAPFPIEHILIQHGFIGANGSRAHDFRGAGQVILWGAFHQDLLQGMPASPPSAAIGNPKLEERLHRLLSDPGPGAFAPDRGQPATILYISSGSLSKFPGNRVHLDRFLEVVRRLTDVDVIYKLHPSEEVREYIPYLRSGAIRARQLIRDADIYSLIQRADIVAGNYSTAVFEAAAMQKPVVQLYTPGQDRTHLLFTHASSVQELQAVLQRLQTDSAYRSQLLARQQQSVQRLFGKVDGAADGIAEHIHRRIRR